MSDKRETQKRDVVCVPLVSSSLGVVWCLDDIMAVSTLTALPDNSAQVKTQLTLPRPSPVHIFGYYI